MNQSIYQKLTNWVVTAVFLVLVVGFSLIDQPSAAAQSQTLTAPEQSTSTQVVSSASPGESVKANVKRLLETKQCAGCNLSGADLEAANLQAANLRAQTCKMQI